MPRPVLLALAFAAALIAAPASAACYADYKAKQDNPLRLHYGVVQLSEASCANRKAAEQEVAARIGRDGWTLLNVLSIFGPEGLDQRKRDAGANFLRY